MARARLLKPGFFTNDSLGEVEPLGRLLFAGLWCLADREGRLPDRPRRIKAELLPYDDADVDRLLDELAARSFVIRYEVDGDHFLQVTAFTRHQRPHHREPESAIPPPTGHGSAMHEASNEHDGFIIGPIMDPDGAMLDASTGQAWPKQVGSCLPLTLNQIQKPIPDPVAVAVPQAAPAGAAAGDPVPLLLRHWERATGTMVTPAFADWLDAELGEGTPADWLRDAISETGANGVRAWKYTRAIIRRWRLQGRSPGGGSDGSRDTRPRRPAEEPCRATGLAHDWPSLDGWCAECDVQEPITEESLRRRGRIL